MDEYHAPLRVLQVRARAGERITRSLASSSTEGGMMIGPRRASSVR